MMMDNISISGSSIEIPDIKCSIILEHLSSNGSLANKSTIPQCKLQLGRNQKGDCVLILDNDNSSNNKNKSKSNQSRKFILTKSKANYQLNTKFVPEGKCSILLKDFRIRLFISNCPPNDLSLFLKGFCLKCTNSTTNTLNNKENDHEFKSPDSRINLIRSRCTEITEKISPLTGNDLLKTLKSKQQQLSATKSDPNSSSDNLTSPLSCKNKKVFQKRKLETILEDISDSSPKTKRKILTSLIPSPVRHLKLLNTTNLTDEQSNVVRAILNGGHSVFFTGSAGTGKSYLLKFLISRLPPESTFITASTGIAACQINGITLHLFSGIPANWLEETSINGNESRKLSPREIVSRLQKNELKIKRWKTCKCLIIDEISMVSGDYFELLDQVARLIRNKKDLPFGGIQLVACGDFLQLPPISRKDKKFHSFQTKAWQNVIKHCFELRQIHRQTDKSFINLLQSIRIGKMNDQVKNALMKTSKNDLRKNNNNTIPTQLYPLRQDVDSVNNSQLMKLDSKSVFFIAEDSNTLYSQVLDSLCPTPKKLELKIGAQVMLNKNIDIQRGLVNGLTGRIIRFENETNSSSQKFLPRISFINGIETVIDYEKWSFKLQDNYIVYRKHLPIQLAWALSVHKSQGMTISSGVEISLSKIFESGQAYVALSRSTSLENIKILDFNVNNIRVDNDALEFYRKLKYLS